MECFCSKTKTIRCKILLLDEQEIFHELQDNSTGQAILDVVFSHINLIETAYFGVRYLDENGQTHWLDPVKRLNKQLRTPDPHTLYFGVKFYAADPCKLLEEITRYQFFLQVKQDILQGRLPVSVELASELGAYVLQSELGDYDPRVHTPGYVSEFRFLSNQSIELETRIADLHKSLIGQLPSTAELQYLDRVKWFEMYGVDLHPVLGEDSVEYFLGLTPSGIIVLRNKITVGNYYWPRITKIYFKGRYFMLKVTDKNNDESTYGFKTPSKSGCKHLWKCCIEHHAFFRLVQVYPTVPDIFALGSRFRYSGRTEKQALRDAQLKSRTPPSFSRTPSRRLHKRNMEEFTSLDIDDVLARCPPEDNDVKHISIPQPAQNYQNNGSNKHSSISSKATDPRRIDSPRSTRSAPWTQPHSKGLYNSSVPPSPRSIRSAGPRYRSSSVDSQSSSDSRSCRRRRHKTSDNESELSKGSSRSHHKRRRHRSRSRRNSRSDGESSSRRSSKVRNSDSQYELIDSGHQWHEIKKRISAVDGNANTIQQANVVSGYKIESADQRRTDAKYKHHRSHSSGKNHSPSESKAFLSDEVKKHLEFDLIDTSGMSENQLREIPYTVVEANNNFKHAKTKHPPWNSTRYKYPQQQGPLTPAYNHQTSKPPKRNETNHFGSTDFTQRLPNERYPESNGRVNGHHPHIADQNGSNNLSDHFKKLKVKNLYDNSMTNGSPSLGSKKDFDVRSTYSENSRHRKDFPVDNRNFPDPRKEYHENQSRISHEHSDSGLGNEQEAIYNTERFLMGLYRRS